MRLHVLIPTYNCGQFIVESIESVLVQKIDSLRITVVDNASTDNTRDIVTTRFQDRVEYIRNAENIGGIRNHNKCLDLADAQYVKLLSADDILLPGILEEQIRVLDENSNVSVATCDCRVINMQGIQIGVAKYLAGTHSGVQAIKQCTDRIANYIGGPSNTMLRHSEIKNNRWDPSFAWTADLMFFCDLLKNYDLFGSGEVGVAYRRRSGSISDVSCPRDVRKKSDLEFIRRYTKSPIPYARWAYRYLVKS